MPENDSEKYRKMSWIVEMMQKNRRNLKCLGCITDLNGEFSNWKLKGYKSEEKSSFKSKMVAIFVTLIVGFFEDCFYPLT